MRHLLKPAPNRSLLSRTRHFDPFLMPSFWINGHLFEDEDDDLIMESPAQPAVQPSPLQVAPNFAQFSKEPMTMIAEGSLSVRHVYYHFPMAIRCIPEPPCKPLSHPKSSLPRSKRLIKPEAAHAVEKDNRNQ